MATLTLQESHFYPFLSESMETKRFKTMLEVEEDTAEELTNEDLIDLLSDLIDEEVDEDDSDILELIYIIAEQFDLPETFIGYAIYKLSEVFQDEDDVIEPDENLEGIDWDAVFDDEEEYEENDEEEELDEGHFGTRPKRVIRHGKIIMRKKGFKKNKKGQFKRIKLSTFRKLKRSARIRKHRKLKPTVRAKIRKTRKKVFRRFKMFIKRETKANRKH